MHPQPHRLLLLAVLLLAHAQPARADELSRPFKDLAEIEARALQLSKMPLRKSELRSPTYVEERLTDGELYFRLQDYVRASIILTDIVDNHVEHPAMPDALFLLGESLFKAGDHLGARAKYRLVIDHADKTAYRPYIQRALGRLIEIAIHTSDFTGVDDYFARLSRLPPSEVESATNYFRAKYLYSFAIRSAESLDNDVATDRVAIEPLEQARQAFEAVSERSPYFPQARYFIGVIQVLRSQLGPAVDAFRRVTKIKAATEEHRRVVDLAFLAMGRIQYEAGQLEGALDAYESVPRTSALFDTALYEIAWVYIRMNDPTRAERALEVLSVAVPDSRHIPDGKLLRGNLLLRNGRYDDAAMVFEEVTDQFGPVRDELDKRLAAHEDPRAYFQQLVRDNLESFDAGAFLPPLALHWASAEGEMTRGMGVLSDLAQGRLLVRETENIVTRLRGALSGGDPVNVFRDMRVQREHSLALQNRLSRVRAALLAADDGALARVGSPELTALHARRRELERALGGLPTKDDDLQARTQRAARAYVMLERELSKAKVELLGMEARITATQRFIEQTRPLRSDQTSAFDAVDAELRTQQTAIVSYRARAAELAIELESARLHVGVGDEQDQREAALRKEHEGLVTRERGLLRQLGAKIDPRVDSALLRVDNAQARLEARDTEVNAIVAERVREMQGVIAEETVKLIEYRERLAALEQDTVLVVGDVAYANYRKVQKRFYDLVLRADVGVIDVAWAIREEHRVRAEQLTRERVRALKALDDEYRDITDQVEAAQ